MRKRAQLEHRKRNADWEAERKRTAGFHERSLNTDETAALPRSENRRNQPSQRLLRTDQGGTSGASGFSLSQTGVASLRPSSMPKATTTYSDQTMRSSSAPPRPPPPGNSTVSRRLRKYYFINLFFIYCTD